MLYCAVPAPSAAPSVPSAPSSVPSVPSLSASVPSSSSSSSPRTMVESSLSSSLAPSPAFSIQAPCASNMPLSQPAGDVVDDRPVVCACPGSAGSIGASARQDTASLNFMSILQFDIHAPESVHQFRLKLAFALLFAVVNRHLGEMFCIISK